MAVASQRLRGGTSQGIAYHLRVLRVIAGTDFKRKYTDSVLGYVWSLAKPLALFSVLYVVFGRFFKLTAGFEHYPLYLLVGIVLWTFFADATTVTEQESIRRRLEIVESQLSAARENLGSAQRRLHLVPVSVTIDADRALADGGDGGGWGLGDAVDDAGKVLAVTAGVLLVSAAVLGPLAILAVLIWLAVRALTRLRRERALDQI